MLQALREFIDNIATLVDLTTLNQCTLPERIANGRRERLRAIDNEQKRAVVRDAALDEICNQRATRLAVLGRALLESEQGVDRSGRNDSPTQSIT